MMTLHKTGRWLTYLLMVIASSFAIGVSAQSVSNVRLSMDVGWSAFGDESQFSDVLNELGPPDVRGWSVIESLSAPHLGLNVHLGENWLVGAKYQWEKRDTLEIRRSNTALIDRINVSTSWSSVLVERQILSNSTIAWSASIGATRAITNVSSRASGSSASTRLKEIDPVIGTGFIRKWGNWQGRMFLSKRFADDSATEMYELSFRYIFGS